MFPGLGYEAVPWYDQFNEFASKNPEGLAQVLIIMQNIPMRNVPAGSTCMRGNVVFVSKLDFANQVRVGRSLGHRYVRESYVRTV